MALTHALPWTRLSACQRTTASSRLTQLTLTASFMGDFHREQMPVLILPKLYTGVQRVMHSHMKGGAYNFYYYYYFD